MISIIEERRGQANFQLVVITHDEDFLSELGRSDALEKYWYGSPLPSSLPLFPPLSSALLPFPLLSSPLYSPSLSPFSRCRGLMVERVRGAGGSVATLRKSRSSRGNASEGLFSPALLPSWSGPFVFAHLGPSLVVRFSRHLCPRFSSPSALQHNLATALPSRLLSLLMSAHRAHDHEPQARGLGVAIMMIMKSYARSRRLAKRTDMGKVCDPDLPRTPGRASREVFLLSLRYPWPTCSAKRVGSTMTVRVAVHHSRGPWSLRGPQAPREARNTRRRAGEIGIESDSATTGRSATSGSVSADLTQHGRVCPLAVDRSSWGGCVWTRRGTAYTSQKRVDGHASTA